MAKHKLYVTIAVEVESDLSIEEAIDEFTAEADYDFKATDNVEPISSEWILTTSQPPEY